MRVRRTFLYWGAFLLALGAVLVAADLDRIDDAAVRDALRLWPLVIVALGIGLVLRGTRAGWAGGMLAAAMPGLLLGGVIVAGPSLLTICANGPSATTASRQGTFAGAATVDLRIACGEIVVGTAPGMGWQLDADNANGRSAVVEASPDRLSVTSGGNGWADFRTGRDSWRLTLPTAVPVDLDLKVDAGAARLNLAGARLGSFSVTADAADGHADLTGATVEHLTATLNAGQLAITLPATGDLDGALSVNAGALKICAPADLGLRIRSDVTLGSAHYPGLVPSGGAWESPNYSTAPHRADLTVDANLGSIDLNPTGGCQ